MLYLSRRYDFAASHRLFNPDFDEEKNWAIFYDCNNPNGHGHNYEIEVIIAGLADSDTGMLIDIVKLDRLVEEQILNKVDHKHLNLDVPMFKGVITTAENIAKVFFETLAPQIPSPAQLYGNQSSRI